MTLNQQLRHWNALLFNEASIELLRTFSSWKWARVNFFLGVFLLSLPLTYDEVFTTPQSYAWYLVLYAGLIIALFGLSRLFGSEMPLVKFWHTVSTLVLFSAIPLTIVTYVALFLLEWILDNAAIPNLIVSVIPFYLYLLMAFGAEQAARIASEKKSIAFGIVSVVVIYSAFYFL
ncbi:hypothetical protein HY641_02020 [Candidatus Woesearchaeota archaeon]|nr:hypothetical protein [Candidatus Woesearchaeota archaeon]